ncbi:hypothetical protein R1sor_024664 [Riccia sorocarpa]|uniref:CYTH domain-containing protein n=1 Tax=Riccia sorocarpa TaxID=122646 RepID=A0ABD3GR56_9MARC
MLKRKPTRLEFKEADDKEELEQARHRAASAAVPSAAAGSSGGSTGGGPTTPQGNVFRPKITLKLPSPEAHEKVASALSAFHEVTHMQENVFFDGANTELSSKRAVLRLRFYDGDGKCVVTFKGNAVIVDGISRGEELEEDIDVSLGRACVAEPWRLTTTGSNLLNKIVADYGCKDFVCLGGFRNVRNVFNWEGLKIELDETQYDFGTTYEVECESTDPERVRQLLGDFLKSRGIGYIYSTKSKFAVFRSGKLE